MNIAASRSGAQTLEVCLPGPIRISLHCMQCVPAVQREREREKRGLTTSKPGQQLQNASQSHLRWSCLRCRPNLVWVESRIVTGFNSTCHSLGKGRTRLDINFHTIFSFKLRADVTPDAPLLIVLQLLIQYTIVEYNRVRRAKYEQPCQYILKMEVNPFRKTRGAE